MLWMWISFIVFILFVLALDLGVFHRKAHAVSMKEALGWSAVWIALGLAFSVSFLPTTFPTNDVGPINVGRTLCIAAISTACWPIGFFAGTLIKRSRRPQM